MILPSSHESTPLPTEGSHPQVPRDTAPSSIMIVEDDLDLRALMTEALTFEGYSVRAVADSDAALAILRDRVDPVRLVLLDMPDQDDACQRFTQHVQTGSLPVPIVVVSGSVKAPAWAAEMGAGFLAKPYELAALYAVVQTFASPVT